MNISTDSANKARLEADHRNEEQKKSDRFSQTMKEQKKRDDEKLAAAGKGSVDGRRDIQPSATANVAFLQTTTDPAARMGLGQPVAGLDDMQTSRSRANAPVDVQQLATEIGAQIDVFKKGNAAASVHITFDSKTLAGLQVQIHQQDGRMAINFITQSPGISSLLKQHTSDLRGFLMEKGVRVGRIAVGSTAEPHSAPRYDNA